MDIEKLFKSNVKKLLTLHAKIRVDVDKILEKPPESTGADLALPCFYLTRIFRKDPRLIAIDIAEKIKPDGLIKEVKADGPYVNFYMDMDKATQMLLTEILEKGEKYGHVNIGKGKRVMVEYSSPNTNKPLHLGHLRNDSIGMAISNILEANGFKVIKAVLFNNRGIHICKSMLAYKRFGRERKPNIKSDHFVGKFYVLYEKHKKKLEKELSIMLQQWENGDKSVIKLWKMMDKWAIKGFKDTYKIFGSKFDVEFRESDFFQKAMPIIERGLKKHAFIKEKDGSIIANLEKYNLGKKVILRSDGTSIYITNDLVLTKYKFERYKLQKSIWVVGSEQNLYFKQLFKIFELLGYEWHKNCIHLSYGLIYLPEGKMKSREGKVVDADDIIKEMIDLARNEILKRNSDIKKTELENRAKAIGLGALKYFLLKIDTVKDIYFKPEEAIPFEGNTGPYIQYTHARASSILRKAKHEKKTDKKSTINAFLLKDEIEQKLIKKLIEFPRVVSDAGRDLKPHYIANYLFELSSLFNEFYHKLPVLGSEDEVREARLALVKAVQIVIKNGLGLLNIEAPEKM